MKKRILVISLTLVLGLSLCVWLPVNAQEQTTVRLWSQWGGRAHREFQELIEKYNNTEGKLKGVKVKIEIIPDEFHEQVMKMMSARLTDTEPDIYHPNQTAIPYIVGHGLLTEPSEEIQQYVRDNYYPPIVNMSEFNGVIYGYPTESQAMALVYNAEMFEEAGLDPSRGPRTWSELREYARKLTVYEGGRKVRCGFVFPTKFPEAMLTQHVAMFWGMGEELFDVGKSRTNIASEKGIQLMDLLTNMAADDSTNVGWMEWFSTYLEEKGAMLTMDAWYMIHGIVFEGEPGLKEKTRADYIPTPTGKNFASMIRQFLFCVPKGAKHQEEAWDFLKWLNEKPETRMVKFLTENLGHLPSHKGIPLSPQYTEEMEEGYRKAIEVSRPMPKLGGYEEIMAIVDQEKEAALTQKKTPEQACKDAEKRINEVLEELPAYE